MNWKLRDYSVCKCVDARTRKKDPACTRCDPDGHLAIVKRDQLGMEERVEEYIDRLVRVFRLVRDVMADHALCFVNVGDTYSTGGGCDPHNDNKGNHGRTSQRHGRGSIPDGNLCLVPDRLRLALQADSWIVRSVIVWRKPSCMPASLSGWRWARHRIKVKGVGNDAEGWKRTRRVYDPAIGGQRYQQPEYIDCPGCPKCEAHGGYVLRRGSWRPTSSWEPVLMLARGDGYYADGESVKTASSAKPHSRGKGIGVKNHTVDPKQSPNHTGYATAINGPVSQANLRDVWTTTPGDLTRADMLAAVETLSTDELRDLLCPPSDDMEDTLTVSAEPLKERHYAAFPTSLVAQCLRAATSAWGYCRKCGRPWCRIIEQGELRPDASGYRPRGEDKPDEFVKKITAAGQARPTPNHEYSTLGWRHSCDCGPDAGEPRPAVILDPFCGSGRTGRACQKLGLDFIGIELSPDNCEMAERILRDGGGLFAEDVGPLPLVEDKGPGLFDGVEVGEK